MDGPPGLTVPRLLKVAEVESHAAVALPATPIPIIETIDSPRSRPMDLKGIWTALGGSPVGDALPGEGDRSGPVGAVRPPSGCREWCGQ